MENLKKQIESKIAAKVGTDPGFKKALLENPKSAIEGTLGIAIPSGVQVVVKEQGGISVILSAGAKGTEIEDELLEQVAGGGLPGGGYGS